MKFIQIKVGSGKVSLKMRMAAYDVSNTKIIWSMPIQNDVKRS